jgi:cell division protein FtsB
MSATVPSPTVVRRPRAAGDPQRPTRAARASELRRRRVRLTARASVLAVVVMVLLTVAIAPVRTLLDQRGELIRLQREAQVLERRNGELDGRIAELGDPVYLERLARECLGMVEPGETRFVVIPQHGAPPPPQC